MTPESPRLHTDAPSALPAGTRLGEFELLSLLGVGGFGIVYLAFDHTLEREVAVKEYMPATLAGRTQTMHVSLRSQSDAETFALGLRSFVNEARLLARFDHPSLLKVYRFWEANGTAYMAMPVMRGHTLKDELQLMHGKQQPTTEAWLRALLDPLLDALAKLHAEGVYHRDIAPDNIQIEPDGHPVLLDFGAARRVISDKSQTLTAILKPAYAPIEQYAEAGAVKQGPWTDIYALGATLYFLMLKRPPPPATARAVHDEASALTTQALPNFSARFLHIVNWMLAPRPADRPQNVAALRRVLDGQAPPPLPRVEAAPEPVDWDSTVILRAAPLGASSHTQALAAVQATATVVPLSPALVSALGHGSSPAPKPAAKAADKPVQASSRIGVGVAAVVLVAGTALAGLLYFFWPHSSPAAPAVVLTEPSALPAAAGASAVLLAKATEPLVAAPPDKLAEPAQPPAAGSASGASMAQLPPALESSAPAVLPAAVPGLQGGAAVATTPASPLTTAAPAAAAAVAAPAVIRAAAADRPLPAKRPSTAPTPATGTGTGTGTLAATPAKATATIATAATPSTSPVAGNAKAQNDPYGGGYGGGAGGVVTAPEPGKAPVLGPDVQCGGLPYFKNLMCMEKQCLRSENQSHPDCLKWRKNAKQE
jgi:serine/threonine protein kinase